MADLPRIGGSRRQSLTIPNAAFLQDHRFMQSAVLPAVLALEHLARVVGRSFPGVALAHSADIRLDKFLPLPAPGIPSIDAFADLATRPDGCIEAALLTRHVAARSGMTRMKAHVRACFGLPLDDVNTPPPIPWRPGPKSQAFKVPAERLYAEMVPFGRAFRNVVSPVRLWPQGAMAIVSGGPGDVAGPALRLGSPFALDAAFHAACAWAQRYAGIVAFPVAAARRRIWRPTLAGRRYQAWIAFRGKDGNGLIFDLRLGDRRGRLCESVRGLAMRDVSGDRLKPPDWVRAR